MASKASAVNTWVPLVTGSSVHGILQARMLEWVSMPSRVSSQPKDRTQVSQPKDQTQVSQPKDWTQVSQPKDRTLVAQTGIPCLSHQV